MIVNEIPIKLFFLGDEAASHQEVLPVREKTARTREVTRMREARPEAADVAVGISADTVRVTCAAEELDAVTMTIRDRSNLARRAVRTVRTMAAGAEDAVVDAVDSEDAAVEISAANSAAVTVVATVGDLAAVSVAVEAAKAVAEAGEDADAEARQAELKAGRAALKLCLTGPGWILTFGSTLVNYGCLRPRDV